MLGKVTCCSTRETQAEAQSELSGVWVSGRVREGPQSKDQTDSHPVLGQASIYPAWLV